MTTEVQTRSEEGGLNYFKSVKEAFDYAEEHRDVWKISWSQGDERLRFIRNPNWNKKPSLWGFEPILLDEPGEEPE